MAETSFSWNFDTGTLTDAVVNSLQGRCGYGLPLAACLPGSNDQFTDSKQPNQRAPGQLGSESDKLLCDISDKVILLNCLILIISVFNFNLFFNHCSICLSSAVLCRLSVCSVLPS